MTALIWWMRIVGVVYLFLMVAASFLRLPIRAEGPPGVLAQASAGDAVARFVVDTWFTFGLFLGAVAVGLWVASFDPGQAYSLVCTVILMEAAGIVVDVYKVARGYRRSAPAVWMIIHSLVIVTGMLVLRGG
jgi:hypothetical protein